MPYSWNKPYSWMESQYLYVIGPEERFEIITGESQKRTFGPLDGPFKVGKSKNPRKRLSHYQTHNWCPLRVHLIQECDPQTIKSVDEELKKQLKEFLELGEWYYCSIELIFRKISTVFRIYYQTAIQKRPVDVINYEPIDDPIGEFLDANTFHAVKYLDMWKTELAYMIENWDEELDIFYFRCYVVDDDMKAVMAELGISDIPEIFNDRSEAETAINVLFRKISDHLLFQGRI